MNLKIVIISALISVFCLQLTDTSPAGLGVLLPLWPVASITGHAGLWGSGLAGPALLRLKAAAALAALFYLTGNRVNLDVGYGFNPGKGGGRGWGRRKRDVSEADARGETAESPDLKDYDPSLDVVLDYDQLGCGMRLVCELASVPFESLQNDEKLILELFGRDGKAPDPRKSSRGKLTYAYASLLGTNSRDPTACARVYARCPYNGPEIMQSLRQSNL